jgi:hypothetical protein
MADGGHFPIQNTNDPGLGLVEDKIVDFKISMNKSASVTWLCGFVREESDVVFEVRQLAHRLFRIHIHRLGLQVRDPTQGGDLTVIEPGVFSKSF